MNKFLVSTPEELKQRGWDSVDIVLVSGDAYIDHPSFGAAVIGRILERQGYRVAVCDTPDYQDPDSIAQFGAPRLFFAVTGGNVDSVMMRYTSSLKVRNDDPFRPAGCPPRPLRAVIAYTNLIRSRFKGVPIVIGGIEASMRRLAHYDFLDNRIRRSLLLDSRADVLVWGMGEHAIVNIAGLIKAGKPCDGVAGTVIVRKCMPENIGEYKQLPDEELLTGNDDNAKKHYSRFFKTLYTSSDSPLVQRSGQRFLIQYPAHLMTGEELDSVYNLPFTYSLPPKYRGKTIPAFTMIQNSINAHRGCVSGCGFCSIAMHQGRRVISRSEESILRELDIIKTKPEFKGHLRDVGGPSANMYKVSCRSNWRCVRTSCLYPNRCQSLITETGKWMKLLEKCRTAEGVKKVTIGSGIRYDLFYQDYKKGLEEFVAHYVGGQLKIAPEHTEEEVLSVMRKTPLCELPEFVTYFKSLCKKLGVEYYLIPYLMSNHPGCTLASMKRAEKSIKNMFGFVPEQVQSFFPLPLTLSSAIYYTGIDPLTDQKVFVERDKRAREAQHSLFYKNRTDKKTQVRRHKR
ncbi:MAG: YgiQ family radical SAM protein [Spirochaetes bacterium]|jgi:uncharacterized radical SAM protein YgiQ|nr:YgiQ family radical SAM protein [Spirochaetota bacterium]